MHYNPPGISDSLNVLAIDFDGVIHNDDKGWYDGTCYGEPISGALNALKLLSNDYRLVVFSGKARRDRPHVDGKTGEQLIWDWLRRHDMAQFVHEVTSEKPRALYFVDDKGIRFVNWQETISFISNGSAQKI